MLQGPNKVAMQDYNTGFSKNSILRYLLVLKINIELNNSFATVLITTVPSLPPPADTLLHTGALQAVRHTAPPLTN